MTFVNASLKLKLVENTISKRFWKFKEILYFQGDHFVMLHPVVIQTDSEHGEKDDVFVGKSIDANGVRLIAVLEFIRKANNENKTQGAFREEDEEIADSYSSWGEVALHYSDLYLKIERQKNLSGFLLDVVKYESIFQYFPLLVFYFNY